MQITKKHVHHIPWSTIGAIIKNNAVLCVAVAAALITSFIVPPDKAYLGYFDWKTLTCLFCVLTVVCALKNISFFTVLAEKIVALFKNARACVLALAYITFLGSMLIWRCSPFCPLATLFFHPRARQNTWRSPLLCKISRQILAVCLPPLEIRKICTFLPSLLSLRENSSQPCYPRFSFPSP